MTDDDRTERLPGADPQAAPWWSRPAAEDPWRPPAEPPADAPTYTDTAPIPPVGGGSQPGATRIDPAPGPTGTATRPVEGWGYPVDTVGRPVGGTRRSLLWLLLPVALIASLVGGGIGGWVGYRSADRSRSGPLTDQNATLGAPTGTTAGSASRPPDSVAGIARKVLPSVVSISVRSSSSAGTGSGVILRSDDYILTNNHVVAEAGSGGRIDVTYSDNRTSSARIVGVDPKSDLAVIKAAQRGGTPAELGNSDDLVVGDPVIAIGSPLGLQGTVTSGIVSAKNRPVTPNGEAGSSNDAFFSAIQTDAAVNPGNSGGPLVNSRGQVVGINSAIATLGASNPFGGQSGSIGLGFAIPIDQARSVAEQLIRTGKAAHPVLGVRATTLSPQQAESMPGSQPGALISGSGTQPGIVSGGPADKAGLRAGDIIVAIDRERVTGIDELIVAVRAHQVGDVVTVTYLRGGTSHRARVTLGSDSGG